MKHSVFFETLPWEHPSSHPVIIPYFLPFQGCPKRCVYCAQNLVTGVEKTEISFEKLWQSLAYRKFDVLPEFAFYGGTFTALDDARLEICLSFIHKAIAEKRIEKARCSTRPDFLSPSLLKRLWDAGFRTIELGIQSFHEKAITASKRGYSSEKAIEACEEVRAHGFDLGVQLMPGMPFVTHEIFLQDVACALRVNAKFLRFYPCLVLPHTELAVLWQRGEFVPWDLEQTVISLARAYLLAFQAHATVIRMGLPPEKDLFRQVLAGPLHPDLGSRVQGRALYEWVAMFLVKHQKKECLSISLPRHTQGYFWGHRRELAPLWKALGIDATKVHFEERKTILLGF